MLGIPEGEVLQGWVGTVWYVLTCCPSLCAESLTWTYRWICLRGRQCRDGWLLLDTSTYLLDAQTLCCRISDLVIAVEIPKGEVVWVVVTSGYQYLFT